MQTVGRRYAAIVAAVIVMALSGCASIVSGSHQNVSFSTTPEGATVTVYDEYDSVVWTGLTPVTARMERGDGFFRGARYRVELSLPGYETVSVFITPEINAGWYFVGNLFIGGWIGWLIVDPATGAMWTLRPEIVSRRLSESAAARGDGDLRVVLREHVPGELAGDLEYLGTMARRGAQEGDR